MNGSPMSWCNTPALFLDRIINEIIDDGDVRFFQAEENGVAAWLDDLLIYARTFDKLLNILEILLQRAKAKQVRFNLRKCGFGEQNTIWCGREVREGLWNFSPVFFKKILDMPRPEYRHQAAQLMYLANWLSPNIQYLADLRKPFAHFANLGGKKLAQIEKEKELITWTPELEKSYSELKLTIVEASKRFLSTYDHKKPLLLFTDSSSDTWSLSLFQDDLKNVNNDVRALRPRPLMFLSGSFANSELRSHIASKELYPIVYAFERIGFMLRIHAGGIFVYTDHKALLSILKTKENEKRIYWDRLYRWILRLQAVDMVIFHIPSRDNFVADLLTRWGKEQSTRVARCTLLFNENTEFSSNKNDLYEYSLVQEEEDGENYSLNPTEGPTENIDYFDASHFSQEYEYEALKVRRIGENISKKGEKRQEDLHFKDVLEASVTSTLEELRDDIFKEHISFLSPFYPNGKWENINLKKIKKHQQKLTIEFREKCEDKDRVPYFRNKIVIPRSLLVIYIVTNHIMRCHPSKNAEIKYLDTVYLEGITKKDLKSLFIEEALAGLQQKAYTITKFKRELENQNKNKSYGLFVNYAPGDYVLIAEEGTQNANEKTKLAWLGPYQVVEVISTNVYQVESITGKLRIVHGSRMWFYSHQKPLGGEKLKSLFIHNFAQLEVEKILQIKTVGSRNPQYKLKVRWLGFSSKSDTWEPLIILYQDIPVMVRRFIEKSIHDEDFKVYLFNYLGDIDRKKFQKKQNRVLRLNRISKKQVYKVENYTLIQTGNTLGRFPQEKKVLNALVMKFGLGNYSLYKAFPHLPFRSQEEFHLDVCKEFLLEHGITSTEELKRMRLSCSQDVVDIFLSCKDLLDNFVDFIRGELSIWQTLSRFYCYVQSMETIPKPYFNDNEVETFNGDSGLLSVTIASPGIVQLTYFQGIDDLKLLVE
eukprot:augustus_masked-scaffold_46-processed-gene-0.3-mRNA-1 protein AED:1.00 eAED:1.00 QI:0/0/0/0/1/1/3/0/932